MSDKKQKGQEPKSDNVRDADEISDEALESVAGGCQHGCSLPTSDFLKLQGYDGTAGGTVDVGIA